MYLFRLASFQSKRLPHHRTTIVVCDHKDIAPMSLDAFVALMAYNSANITCEYNYGQTFRAHMPSSEPNRGAIVYPDGWQIETYLQEGIIR